MSDQTTQDAATEAAAPTDPQPDAAAAANPPADPTPDPVDDFDKDRALATIRAQREAEKALKAQLAEARKAQDELAQIRQAQETEQERLQRERAEAIAKAETAEATLRQGHLLAELAKPEYGIVDAEAAARLIEGIEYGDDGRPTNAKERIDALLVAKGYLKATPTVQTPRAPDINGGSGTAGAAPPKLTAAEVRMAERAGMTPEEYAAFRDSDTVADLTRAGLTT